MKKYKFGLVMATYGRKVEVGQFLSSILNINYDLNMVQIIIVDQNDNIDLAPIINKYNDKLNITHVRSEIKGISYNRNIGMGYADCEFLAFPDDDCKYLKDTLRKVESFFKANEDVNILIGKAVDENGRDSVRKWPGCITNINSLNFYNKLSSIGIFIDISRTEKPEFNEKLGGGNYFGSCEDADIIYKYIRRKNKILFVPSIEVYHPSDSNENSTLNKIKGYSLGFGGFCRENLSISIFLILVESVCYHFVKFIMGILCNKPSQVKRSLVSMKYRFQGFLQYTHNLG